MSVSDDCKKKDRCLLESFRKKQEVDLTVLGFDYSGTFLAAHKGVVVVEDPFELNFIAARSVSVVTLPKSQKDKGKKIRIDCQDPVCTFIKLLISLINKPVLIQVESTFIQGAVFKVSASKKQLTLLISSGGCQSTVLISIENIAVILVPLNNTNGIIFGDFMVTNNTVTPQDLLLFQKPPA
ncbi:MAG: hypothetical protein Hyperionvirus3_118 [Hyperionvirus sp.]|uniref:Uncharacterized protein n=1 Tax=Hyperionvirus sp. TaxID=2487770 RepID=A0A3G5A7F3_9VIRU|nr:MAG: hypothetical protein Hyperionvirus3_118 [Hyperionvirus sp.]